MHPRSRSCSPVVESPAASKGSTSGAPNAVATAGAAASLSAVDSSAASSYLDRGRQALVGGQQRPPRPPPLQVQQQQAEQRSPFDVFNVASAVAAVLMSRASAAAVQQQQDAGGEDCHDTPRLASSSGGWRLPAALSGLLQQRGRQSAEAEEAALLAGGSGDGDGWESVEASEASLTLPTRRDFSSAHLLAPLVDQAAVAGVTPRTMSSSSSASCGTMRAGFSGAARAKVVAADLNTTGSKDYVEFKVGAADPSPHLKHTGRALALQAYISVSG